MSFELTKEYINLPLCLSLESSNAFNVSLAMGVGLFLLFM